jgi:hypothetical protein
MRYECCGAKCTKGGMRGIEVEEGDEEDEGEGDEERGDFLPDAGDEAAGDDEDDEEDEEDEGTGPPCRSHT